MGDHRETLLQLMADELRNCSLVEAEDRRETAIDMLELIARRLEFSSVKEMLEAREWTRTYALQQLRQRCAQVAELQQRLSGLASEALAAVDMIDAKRKRGDFDHWQSMDMAALAATAQAALALVGGASSHQPSALAGTHSTQETKGE